MKIPHNLGYTNIPNEVLNDERLSFEAIGVYCACCTFPPGKEIDIKELKKMSSDDIQILEKAIEELKKFGYLKE
jgi:hypothetical protein